MKPALASTNPAIRRAVHRLAVLTVGPRLDWEFLVPSLKTCLIVELHDFQRLHRADGSYGFESPAAYQAFMDGALPTMAQWGAQVQPTDPLLAAEHGR